MWLLWCVEILCPAVLDVLSLRGVISFYKSTHNRSDSTIQCTSEVEFQLLGSSMTWMDPVVPV